MWIIRAKTNPFFIPKNHWKDIWIFPKGKVTIEKISASIDKVL